MERPNSVSPKPLEGSSKSNQAQPSAHWINSSENNHHFWHQKQTNMVQIVLTPVWPSLAFSSKHWLKESFWSGAFWFLSHKNKKWMTPQGTAPATPPNFFSEQQPIITSFLCSSCCQRDPLAFGMLGNSSDGRLEEHRANASIKMTSCRCRSLGSHTL